MVNIYLWLLPLFPLSVVLAGRLSIEAGLWLEARDGRRHRRAVMLLFLLLYGLLLLLVALVTPSPV